MKYRLIVATLSLAALQAIAQGGPGPGPGQMRGGGPGPMCQEKDAPPGCKLMSADEMKAHREKMHSMTDKKSCMAYMDEHHKTMQERAAKTGDKLPEKPTYGRCARLN
jgi:hypothetical protein